MASPAFLPASSRDRFRHPWRPERTNDTPALERFLLSVVRGDVSSWSVIDFLSNRPVRVEWSAYILVRRDSVFYLVRRNVRRVGEIYRPAE